MVFTRRPVDTQNRGRIPTSSGGEFVAPDGTIVLASPSADSTLEINTARTFVAYVAPDIAASVTSVEFYLDYPLTPLGAGAQVSPTRWEITYTPDLLAHGDYSAAAYAIDGGSNVLSDLVDVSVSAVPQRGTWAANGGVWIDYRFVADAPGEVTPDAPLTECALELAAGATAPTPRGTAGARPIVRTGPGFRKALEVVSTSAKGAVGELPSRTGADEPWTLVIRLTTTTGTKRGAGTGNSAAATNQWIDLHWSSGAILRCDQRDASNVTAAAILSSDLDAGGSPAHTVILTSDGTQVRAYIDGAADASNPQSLDVGSLTINRYAIGGGIHGTTLFGPHDGQDQVFGFKWQYTDAAGALAIHNHIVASDQEAPSGAPVLTIGDSVTACGTTGGWRKALYNDMTSALAIDLVGPDQRGDFPDNDHCGFAGQQITEVEPQQIDVYLGTAGVYPTCQCVIYLIGTNDVDNPGKTLGEFISDYTASLDALHAKLVSAVASARIVVATVLPIDGTTFPGADTLVASINGGAIQAVWDAHDLANPSNKVFRWDPYQALGSAWSTTHFQDSRHPKDGTAGIGYSLMATHATYGLYVASDGTQTFEDYLDTIG